MTPANSSLRPRRPLVRWVAYTLAGVLYGIGITVWRLADAGTPLSTFFAGPTLRRVLLNSLFFALTFGAIMEAVAWFRSDHKHRGDDRGAAP